ncbi:MAG: ATP-grasp domain-containing protein [Myxococcota bacterium]
MPTDPPGSPSILLLACDDWASACRLPAAAHAAGFTVHAFAHRDHLVHRSRFVDQRFEAPPADTLGALAPHPLSMMQECAADLVVPVDDGAVALIAMLLPLLPVQTDPRAPALLRTLLRSVGSPRHYGRIHRKLGAIEVGSEAGMRVPATAPCGSPGALEAFVGEHGFPVVLKGDLGCAGQEVRVCGDAESAALARVDLAVHSPCVQAFVPGRLAMVNATLWQGEVVASASFLKRACHPGPTGPSSVVEHVDEPALDAAMAAFARYTGLSGIVSLDFVLSPDGPVLLECNPRTTPVSHLASLTGVDLFGALRAALSGATAPRAPSGRGPGAPIALFPNELSRDPASPWFCTAVQDVPWSEPELVTALLDGVAPFSSRPAPG